MPVSKLVHALRSGDESKILEVLLLSAGDLLHRLHYGLESVEQREAETLIRKGGVATRLTLTYHPNSFVREVALRTIKPRDVAPLEALLRNTGTLPEFGKFVERLGLTNHRSGYVREAALLVIRPGDGTRLVTFLRLSNDWVPTVASLAQRKARAALSVSTDADLAEVLPIVYGLTLRQRVNLRDLAEDYVAEVSSRPGLTPKVRRMHRWGKIGLWSYVAFGGRSGYMTTLAEGINDANALVQLAAAREMVKNPEEWPKLMASRLPEIRKMGLDIAPTEARETALLDHHGGVRNDARFLLGKRDFAAFYRAHLPSLGAISGLGETGSKADAKLLAPLLIDERAEIRRRALVSYTRLLGDDAATELLVALQDPSRKVQRSAVAGLSGFAISLEPIQIIDLNLGTGGAWALMDRCARWPALITVLENLDRFPYAETWLRRRAPKFRNQPFPPSVGQAESVMNLLSETSDRLGEETVAELRSSVQAWVRK